MHIAEKVDVEKLRAVNGQGCIAGLVRRRKYIRAVCRFLRIRRIVTASTTLAFPQVEPTGAQVPHSGGLCANCTTAVDRHHQTADSPTMSVMRTSPNAVTPSFGDVVFPDTDLAGPGLRVQDSCLRYQSPSSGSRWTLPTGVPGFNMPRLPDP